MQIVILSVAAVISLPVFAVEDKPAVKIIAYYFHGSFRCSTCTSMEKYSKEAIETNFKDVLASGKLEFKVVNVEERGNEHFVKDYQLYTKSLILSMTKNGKGIKSKNLDKIWKYAGNKRKFTDYVIGEINGFMRNVR